MRRWNPRASFRRIGRSRTFTGLGFVLLLVLGILTSWQIRSIAEERTRLKATERDYAYFAGLIESEKSYVENLRQKMDDLALQKTALQDAILQGTGDAETIAQLKRYRELAGFTAVDGAGIVVTLDDSNLRTPDMDPMASIIHDADIRQVVDLLRAGGAIAISVNGQRIVPTSELICNGPTILINGLKYPVPYRVEAVGNPDLLTTMIESDEYLGYRKAEGVQIVSERKDAIAIAPFDRADRVDTLIDALEVTQP
jgi:uncharacterized protein YlxW (UPF0749 family)